jgi:hypothetical protein
VFPSTIYALLARNWQSLLRAQGRHALGEKHVARFGLLALQTAGTANVSPPNFSSVAAAQYYRRRQLELGDPAGVGAEIRMSKSLAQRTAIPVHTIMSKYRSTSSRVTLEGSP